MEQMDFYISFTELSADYEEKEKYDAYTNPMTLGHIICATMTYIITVIGLVLNGLFALFMLLPISYSRRSPIRLLTSRLWLTFGILITQTIQLLLTSSSVVIMDSQQIHTNRVLCILFLSVPESLDFIINVMITLLSFNLLTVIKNLRPNSTRKFTDLLTLATLVAWIIGFVLAFSMTAPFVYTKFGWCVGMLPLYMSLIRAFIDFLVPYICSITAICFTLKAWYERKSERVVEAEISDSPDRVSTTQGKTIVANEILDETGNTNAEADTQIDFNTPVSGGASNFSDLSGRHKESSREKSRQLYKPVTEGETGEIKTDSCLTEDVSGNLELENLNRRSLRMWIVFNALIVFFGFLSRFLLRLPIADIFSNMTTGYYTYMCVAALLYRVNMACVPLLCIIVCEVRHAFNPRVCKLGLKILCWGCDCCVDVDKDME